MFGDTTVMISQPSRVGENSFVHDKSTTFANMRKASMNSEERPRRVFGKSNARSKNDIELVDQYNREVSFR